MVLERRAKLDDRRLLKLIKLIPIIDRDFDQLDWIRIGKKLAFDRVGIFVFKSINYGLLMLCRLALLPNHTNFL